VVADESCRAVICSFVKEKLQLNIAPTDISTSHRIGKKPMTQVEMKRRIVVKLCRRDIKKDILFACRQLKPNFFANENLTPVRNTQMFVLRKMRRAYEDKVLGCSSIDGTVFG
jgi:hypothetical protein